MQKRIQMRGAEKRLLSLPEAAEYVGLGRNTARSYFEEIGAITVFGRRKVIDRRVVDADLDARMIAHEK